MKNLILSFYLLVPILACAQSGTHSSRIDSLVQLAETFLNDRNTAEAQPVFQQAIKLARENFGDKHPLYASCLILDGRIHYLDRNYEDALPLFQEARTILQNTIGDDHLDFATVQYYLGLTHYRLGHYVEAETLFLEAKSIREKHLGRENLDYADVLNQLAVLYNRLARFDEAEQLNREILEIREKLLGKDHPDYIKTLNNLGSTYYRNGLLEPAEELWLTVKAWYEKKQDQENPGYLGTMSNLANLYTDLARYEEAERIYNQVKTVQEQTLGTENADYAFTLTYLGYLCMSTGRYEEAEQHLVNARNINEKVLGKEHPDYAASLELLASLYTTLGMYRKAEPLYLETKDIRQKELGSDHPDYAGVLNNLAVLYLEMHRRDTAEQYYLQSKAIYEKEGTENPDYLWSLNNLAILYTGSGRFEQAETYLLTVKTTREKILGKEHPDYANTLEDLAALYDKMGQPEKALPLQQEAVDIYGKTLGKQHLRYAANLNILAGLYAKLGQPDSAAPIYVEAGSIQRNLLVHATRYLSEREIASYAELFANDLHRSFTFLHLNSRNTPVAMTSFDNALFYKGFLLMSANRIKNLSRSNPAAQKNQEKLAALQRLIIGELAKPISERPDVDEMQAKANELEKELVRTVAGYGEAIRQVTWKEVQGTLKPGEAAIEFIHYQLPESGNFYSALVLKPGEASPQFVPLCEEASLDLLKNNTKRRSDYVSELYSNEGRGAAKLDKPRKPLYELIWQPLEAELKDIKTVYYAPSGVLHRLNIGAISVDEEETLADYFQFVLLGSTRQLVRPEETEIVNQDVLLMGGIQYDLDSAAMAERRLPLEALAGRGPKETNPEINTGSASQNASTWAAIKWTQKEVTSLQPLIEGAGMQAEVLMGNDATEDAFKEIESRPASPRTIHLATHGYFFPDPETTTGTRTLTGQEPVFKISEQPMIRSGLILAGGNYAWRTGTSLIPGIEDGILTAYEISQMDLSHTELVVLSACETGLGDIKGNEGVYGLQRAFKIAGVKYILMSLWEVPDDKTKKLMTNFYSKWLEDKMPIRNALLAAQKEMREIGFSPYDWAGFVLME